MRAFILAGGFATRLWPLTEKRAKPLLPLAGKPIITHIVEKIPEDIAVTVSTNAAFRKGFEDWKTGIDRGNIGILIEDTINDDQKLGALGAVKKWADRNDINEDVLLLTGDNYFGFEIKDFLKTYKEGTPLLAAFDIREKELAKSFGVIQLQDNGKTIMCFEEKPSNPQSTFVSTGCSVLPTETLPMLAEFAGKHPDNVGGIFEEFMRQGISVDCFVFSGQWFDIGSFDAYLDATRKLVGNRIVLEEGSICKETACEGSVILGAGSRVSKSRLKDVVLFENCEIEDCDLEDCILDRSCKLKNADLRRKMVREGTRLALNN